MTYDEMEKQAAPVENLLSSHSQGESREETTVCSLKRAGVRGCGVRGRNQIQIVKLNEINSTSRSHLLLKKLKYATLT